MTVPPATAPPATVHPKPITMKVEWHSIGKFYKVIETTNTSYYVPGEEIPPERIKLINESGLYPNWTVIAVDHDYLQAVMSLFGAAAQIVTSKVVP